MRRANELELIAFCLRFQAALAWMNGRKRLASELEEMATAATLAAHDLKASTEREVA